MKIRKRLHFIFLTLSTVFALYACHSSTIVKGKKPNPIPPNPIIVPCGGKDCLVRVVNNCPYSIYLFEAGQAFAPLTSNNIIPAGGAGEFYPVDGQPNLSRRAIQIGAGFGLGQNGLPSSEVSCDRSSNVGACQLGWGQQGSLFEFTYNPVNFPNNIFYDISAVNGFDFPMTVIVQNPVGTTHAGGCTGIDTAALDVRHCSDFMNLYGISTCNAASSTCVRQAIHASDFSHIYTGGTDCNAPDSSVITACRSPRTFGVNYDGPPTCSSGSLLYTINQDLLPHWTCAGQPNNTSSLCRPPQTPNDPATSYYNLIKSAVGNGVSYTSIYAFPQDDGYSITLDNGFVTNQCSALTPRFILVIGPTGTGSGALGQCPSLPPSPS